MKKSIYYIIQILGSFISLIISGAVALNQTKDAAAGQTFEEAFPAFAHSFGRGALVYLILSIIYIIIGSRIVKGWRWWDYLISLALIPGIWILLGFL